MSSQPETLRDLVENWKQDVARLDNEENDEKIAYDMVGRLAGSDHWDEWYDGNPTIAKIFDLAADLELPPHIRISKEDRPKTWSEIKELISRLEIETNNKG